MMYLFVFISFCLFIYGWILWSSNTILSILCFVVLGLIVSGYAKLPYFKNKRMRLKAKAERQQQKSAKAHAKLEEQASKPIKEIINKFQLLANEPDSEDTLNLILDKLESLDGKALESLNYQVGLPLFQLKPLDERVREVTFLCAQKTVSAYQKKLILDLNYYEKVTELSKAFYNAALDILEQNPTHASLKPYVLKIGRWHCGLSRGGKVTIYDEQSLQNDILVRSQT